MIPGSSWFWLAAFRARARPGFACEWVLRLSTPLMGAGGAGVAPTSDLIAPWSGVRVCLEFLVKRHSWSLLAQTLHPVAKQL